MIGAFIVGIIPILIVWLIMLYCVSVGERKKFPMK